MDKKLSRLVAKSQSASQIRLLLTKSQSGNHTRPNFHNLEKLLNVRLRFRSIWKISIFWTYFRTLEWACEVPPAEISLGQLGSTEQMEEEGQISFESEIQIQKWKSNMRKGQMNWPFKGSDSITNQGEGTGCPKKSCQQNMYRWKGPNKSNDITNSSQGRYREDNIIGVSVDKTQDITLSLELKFHQIDLALFNQFNELKSWGWVLEEISFSA